MVIRKDQACLTSSECMPCQLWLEHRATVACLAAILSCAVQALEVEDSLKVGLIFVYCRGVPRGARRSGCLSTPIGQKGCSIGIIISPLRITARRLATLLAPQKTGFRTKLCRSV